MKEQSRNVAGDSQESYYKTLRTLSFLNIKLRINSDLISCDIQTQVERGKPLKPTELIKPMPKHDYVWCQYVSS